MRGTNFYANDISNFVDNFGDCDCLGCGFFDWQTQLVKHIFPYQNQRGKEKEESGGEKQDFRTIKISRQNTQ